MNSTMKRPARKPARKVNFDANTPPAATPIRIVSVVKHPADLEITFNQPVSLAGVPAYTTDIPGPKANGAQQLSAAVVRVDFDAVIVSAVKVNIPDRDPAIRNISGGYVTANTVTI